MNFRIESMSYTKGEGHLPESIKIDIMWEDGDVEHIRGSADFYIEGARIKSCIKNEYISLGIQQQIAVLEFIRAERMKLIDGFKQKTYNAWKDTCLSFGDFCFPGDTVDEETVDYFVDCMPPVSLRSDCTQCGEPHGTEEDEYGVCRETYITFRKEDGKWIFAGYCFAGENVNRDTKGTYLERMLKKLKAAPTTLRLTFLGADSHCRYVYKDERGQHWKHLDCNSSMEECQKRGDKLYSSCNNAFDGEPDCPMREGIEVEYIGKECS